MSETEKLVYINGINGLTGTYDIEPLPVAELARHAFEVLKGVSDDEKNDLKSKASPDVTFAPPPWTDDQDLSQVGWGVIFAETADPNVNHRIKEALSELLKLRQSQAGPLYKEFIPPGMGHRPGESKRRFLNRFGAGDGVTKPDKVPYYLLIVGDPASIDFNFQYELDLSYAVGRIHFPTIDDYANYARSVVTAEKRKVRLEPQATFFSMLNNDDPSTKSSNNQLAQPLFSKLSAMKELTENGLGWKFNWIGDGNATKGDLFNLMGGKDTPALLFTSSHGMMYPSQDPEGLPEQIPLTGALMGEEWPGRRFRGPIDRDWLFAAEDIDDGANLLGMVSFMLACYGAGSPYMNDYYRKDFIERAPVAPHAFLSRLPQRLLSHPKGGALAVIGHVERAWGNSYVWSGVEQIETIQSVIFELMSGKRVGTAVEYLNSRYAEIGAQLVNKMEQGQLADDEALITEWTACNDARGYIVIGDPAVRLPAVKAGKGDDGREKFRKPAHREGTVPLVLVPQTSTPPVGEEIRSGGMDTGAMGVISTQPVTSELKVSQGENPPEATGQAEKTGLRNEFARVLAGFGTRLSRVISDLSSVDVTTYTCEKIEDVQLDASGKPVSGAQGALMTVITFDGDMRVFVPGGTASPVNHVMEMHTKMVEQARLQRDQMLRTSADLLMEMIERLGK